LMKDFGILVTWVKSFHDVMKSLKLLKWSEAVNLRTDNTDVKWKMNKRLNNDLQNITQKTIDWATRTPLKPVEKGIRCSGMVSRSCFSRGTCRVALATHPNISIGCQLVIFNMHLCSLPQCLSKFSLLLVSILRFTVVVLPKHIVILLSERVDRRVLL
jgi:hypothetical protein